VVNYPATHEIETFCLGHTEFVSSIALISDRNQLLSLSGDKTMKLWNFLDGNVCDSFSFGYVPMLLNLCSTNVLCVTSADNVVYVYKYEIDDGNRLKLKLIGEKNYNCDIEIATGDCVAFVKYFVERQDKKLCIDQIEFNDVANFKCISDDVQSIFNSSLAINTYKSFDVRLLFKHAKKYTVEENPKAKKRSKLELNEN
jgi:WD40 repeat protein